VTRFIPLAALFLVACATEESLDECLTSTLEAELGVAPTGCEAEADAVGDAKADGARAIDKPGLRFLRERAEAELAWLFARGRADAIPTGRNDGTPLLLGKDWLAPALTQIYVGSIWEPVTDDAGEPILQPGGDPVIRLRDAWLRDGDGHLVTLFEAAVTRGQLASVVVAPGISPPQRPSQPHPLVDLYEYSLVLDAKPSLFVNYHDDPAPVINRILDEIREVDPIGCPGLYLGRAHYLRPTGDWVYLYWFGLDFGAADRACTPRMP
jgi:hypothetical protein